MKNNAIGTCVGLCLMCQMSNAYEVPTHENMSESALARSGIATGNVLSQLGLEPYSSNEKFTDPKRLIKDKTLIDLIRQGANFEDNMPRFVNHFYDPINNSGLATMNTSPGWALEDTADDGEQQYSYKDAMQYFYDALTKNTQADRNLGWGKTFQTLGQIIHHVQDMAQPQHVRNEPHFPYGDKSLYEEYSNDQFGKTKGPITGVALDYDIPTFTIAREYWTTRDAEASEVLRKGMADFTNRNFVSEDSNFYYDAAGILRTRNYNLPQPMDSNPVLHSVDITDVSVMGTTAGQTLCNQLKTNSAVIFPAGGCVIDFVRTVVTDAYTNTSSINDRASSSSVFNKTLTDNDLTVPIHHDDDDYEARGVFTLNRFNYDAAHNYLIPRAVSYSAGLINHFFRGKMQISLPDAGVYGLVDKSTLPGMNLETGFIGFSTIKFKVANTTPSLPGQSVPEAMNNGTLEAVIKFHRNTCTEADLSGDTPIKTIEATTDGSKCRSAQEEIVVSSSQTISASNALTSTPREFTFDFTNTPANPDVHPLPLNAIDVYLQVVYKGQLGNEANAVVVATKDISEPSIFTIVNSVDYMATVLSVENYKAYKFIDLNTQQLYEILTDMLLEDPDALTGARHTSYCMAGTLDNMSWVGGAVGGAYNYSCVIGVDPNYRIYDKYTINKAYASPIKITLDGLPPQRYITIGFLADTDSEVTLENTGLTEYEPPLLGGGTVTLEPYEDTNYNHVLCGYHFLSTCKLKVNQTQFDLSSSIPPTPIGKARGVYATGPVLNHFYTDVLLGVFDLFVVVNPSIELTGAYKIIDDQMENVPPSTPFPVTIVGWP